MTGSPYSRADVAKRNDLDHRPNVHPTTSGNDQQRVTWIAKDPTMVHTATMKGLSLDYRERAARQQDLLSDTIFAEAPELSMTAFTIPSFARSACTFPPSLGQVALRFARSPTKHRRRISPKN